MALLNTALINKSETRAISYKLINLRTSKISECIDFPFLTNSYKNLVVCERSN